MRANLHKVVPLVQQFFFIGVGPWLWNFSQLDELFWLIHVFPDFFGRVRQNWRQQLNHRYQDVVKDRLH